MKKLLSYILIIFVMFTMLIAPSSVKAEAKEIKILSPGATCTTELDKIVLSCASAEKIIYELDGEIIGETAGVCELALTDGFLTPGNHALKVTALFGDGTGASDELKFFAEKYVSKMSVVQDFDSIPDSITSGILSATKLSFNKITVDGIRRFNLISDKGYDYDTSPNDKSLCIDFLIDNAIDNNYPHFYVYSGFDNGYDRNGVLVSEFDIKSQTPSLSDIFFENIPNLTHDSNKIMSEGKIAGTDVVATDGWYHFKITHHFPQKTTELEVNNKVLYNGAMEESPKLGAQPIIGFKQTGNRTPETREKIWFDNFNFNNYLVWGLTSVSYDAGDGNWQVYSDGQLPANTSKIKLGVINELKADTVTKDAVKLYENGTEVPVSSVSYANKEVVLTLSKSLSKSSDIKIELGSGIKFASNESVGDSLIARITTEPAPLTPKEITFKKGSGTLYSSSQLASGDSVSVETELNNDTTETQTMTVVLYVIQNKKSRGISAQEFTLDPGQKLPVTITIPSIASLDASGNVSVRMSLCGNISSPAPFMAYTEVK